MSTVPRDVAEIERDMLRHAWWMFPLLGLAAAVLLARYGWAVIALDKSLITRDALRGLKLPYILLVPVFALIPVIWRASINWRAGRQRVAWILAALIVLAAELVFRRGAVQHTFWLATRARCSGGNDFFLREVASMRLAKMDDRADDPRRIIFAGTSQLIRGINYDAAQKALPEFKVCRRSVAGMVPLRILAAQEFISARSNDVVVLYLSEFDMSGLGAFDANWLRPTATPAGFKDVVASLPQRLKKSSWRELVDYATAASSEIWRCRDARRKIVLSIFGGNAAAANTPEAVRRMADEQRAGYQRGTGGADLWEANLNALKKLITLLNERGARVVAFEGQVNPAMLTPDARARHAETRRNMDLIFRRQHASFVPIDNQPLHFTQADFADMTHLDTHARDRFTRYVVTYLRNKVSTIEIQKGIN